MQSDYISRHAAIDTADRADYTGLAVEDVKKVTDEVVKELKQLPSADVAPVVYGKWIRGKYTDDDLRYNDYSYRCNRCGKIVNFEENYCPKCGAKMDGGKS